MQNALLTKFIIKNKREKEFPEFRPGDTIKVHVKIKEGEKERLQAFEGVLIARNGMGMGESITVRKVSFGQGVERIFPVHAKVVDHIDVVRTGRVRRAKLYYLRALEGQGCPSERARIVSVSPCGRFRRVANSGVKQLSSENCARAASTPSPASTKSAAVPSSAQCSPAP